MAMAVSHRREFAGKLGSLIKSLNGHVSAPDGQWVVKGFIDVNRRIYSVSSDTKVLSKLLEISLFPVLFNFAKENGYKLIHADKQNYYPDLSFVDQKRKFALDFKTTYRVPDSPDFCNGFTLGSHGSYFIDRSGRKNIQFPYSSYSGHFCLGIVYSRSVASTVEITKTYTLDYLEAIPSVIRDIQFFVVEKWKIASDKRGSGNTANIGSIKKISDIIDGRGMFAHLGEKWFDDYWMNYGKITASNKVGKIKKITNLHDFVTYRGGDTSLINHKAVRKKTT